ncbi:MAG: hypothetical protein ACXW2Y_00470 [Acidimicrobiia bacterium]
MSDRFAHATFARIALAVLAFGTVPLAFWASFAPRQFYDDFPGAGRTWVAVDGPYNEHLVRDVGALSLALLVVTVFAFVTLSVPLLRATAAAFLANGLLHVGYHLRHLDLYGTADQVATIGGLILVPVVALVLLGATMRPSATRSSPSSTSVSTAPTAPS